MDDGPLAVLSYPDRNGFHDSAAVGFQVYRFDVQMQAVQAIGTVVAVIASRLLWGTETAADLAGKGIRTGVCFIVTFFKSFSFVFPIHDDPPEDEWSELREERRVFLPDLPVRPHTPVIKLSFSKKSPFGIFVFPF